MNEQNAEKILYRATLCFLVEGHRVQLIKKLKKIGAGCFNAHGGGIDEDETALQCIVREIGEETSKSKKPDPLTGNGVILDPKKLKKKAVVDFHNITEAGESFTCRVHVYVANEWTGNVEETDEAGEPTWFDIDKLPLDQMMPADPSWVPVVLGSKDDSELLFAEAWYGPRQKELLQPVQISRVETLPEL